MRYIIVSDASSRGAKVATQVKQLSATFAATSEPPPLLVIAACPTLGKGKAY